MKRKIHLYGQLAQKYGKVFEFDVNTAGEAVCALCVNFKEFEKDIRDDSWLLFRGDPDTGMCLDEEAISGFQLGEADLHIMPEAIGSKKGGILKAIIGITLIVASFGSAAFLGTAIAPGLLGAATWGNVIGQLGLAMALGGAAQLLAPDEQTQPDTDEQRSFTFSGPQNTTRQGVPIPIIYGEVITGGVMISGGMEADKLSIWTPNPPLPTTGTTPPPVTNQNPGDRK